MSTQIEMTAPEWEPQDQIESLRQQLAAANTEIERLKAAIPDKTKRNRKCVTLEDWRRAALYYESQWSNCSYGYNKAIGDLHNQLAAGQAREQQQLREALESVIDQCECDINPGRNDALNEIRDEIRALPGVTLEDLQK